jgi:hydroxyacylglutathione hydrolase
MKTSEEHNMPPYFSRMEDYNRTGDVPPLDELPAPRAMSPGQVEDMFDEAQLVDIRSTEAFAGMFIPGSMHIPLSMLPVFAGWLLDYDRPIILIPESPDQLDQAVRHLVRVGYDRVEGYLRGGVHSWQISGRRYDNIPTVTAEHLDEAVKENAGWTVLDVRKEQTFRKAHVPGAHHCYVGKLPGCVDEIPTAEPIVTLCGSGKMAMIAASILKRKGYSDVRCNLGSMAAMQNVDGEFLTEESGKEAHA